MRILVTIPHFFGEVGSDTTNRSRQPTSRDERVAALTATITAVHHSLGNSVFGLDHGQRIAWQAAADEPHRLDIFVCTTGTSHLLPAIDHLRPLFQSHTTKANPVMLGFECHKLMKEMRGRYDYYCYVEDDIVVRDAAFLRKRRLFDRKFPTQALLQPNRYELSAAPPINKLYVDYRANPRMTELFQKLTDELSLELTFGDDVIKFERSTYPSAGCFFLNAEQLEHWTRSPHFLDGDVSYLSPLDSAATLSIMKAFRIYKPVLDQAWFLEVLHASPRWIMSAPQMVSLVAPNGQAPEK